MSRQYCFIKISKNDWRVKGWFQEEGLTANEINNLIKESTREKSVKL